MRLPTLLLFVFAAWSAGAQQPTPPPPSTYAQQREAALAPGLEALKQKDYATALADFHVVLSQYPHDARVLMLAGNAAKGAKDYEEALADYQQALSISNSWPVRFSLIQTYAALGRWDEFGAERQKIRQAQQNGDPFLVKLTGYVIETFETGDYSVQVLEFPKLNGQFHTRYRFFVTAKDGGNTESAQWTPHIDLESDDIDQVEFAKTHPEKAAAGERSFSLDTYLQPRSQGLIKFYPDGEPTYREVRADVIATISNKSKPLNSTTSHPR